MTDDRLYLVHITECLRLISEYVATGREAFMASTMIQDAVVRRLQTPAESSQRLSDSLKAKNPELDWRGLAGFRNVLVHDYPGVDLERVGELIESKVPQLTTEIEAMLADLGTDE